MDIERVDIERAEKICQMIFELCNYIDSIEDKMEKEVCMDAAIMTLIDISAISNKMDSISMTKHILKDFEIRGI